MILFVISILLVILASYLITSVITPKKSLLGVIYFFLTAFAQIVLTFEILSLFNAITPKSVIITDLIFFNLSLFIWYKRTRTFWKLDINDFKTKFINSLKLDKCLIFLTIGLSILLISSFIMCIILPITNADAQAYHVARSLYWSIQGNLNYFKTVDIRNLCSPINTEILYTWVLLFTKKDLFLGIFSFLGYILAIVSISGILKYIGFSFRKRFWAIAILSSFASVMMQLSSTETDIIVAGLICSAIYLFWTAIRTGHKTPVFMSSLAYALAIGTKTTALIILPGFCIVLLYLSLYFKKPKLLIYLVPFTIINIALFASYNYVQNFLHFNNFIGSESFITTCKNYYGINGTISNLVKYIFDLINFSGINLAPNILEILQNYRQQTLDFYNLSNIIEGPYSKHFHEFNSMDGSLIGLGPLGFLVFLPCVFICFYNLARNYKNNKNRLTIIFALFFIINIISISVLITYMDYSIRFITSFIILSSPVLVYSYTSNKFLKYAITIIATYYLSFISINLPQRPFCKMYQIIMETHSITGLSKAINFGTSSYLYDTIESNFTKKDKIILFLSDPDCVYLFKSLIFQGYNTEIGRLEDFDVTQFNNYNILILPSKKQISSVTIKYKSAYDNGLYRYYKNFPIYCSYIDKSLNPKTTKGLPLISECSLSKFFLDENYIQILDKPDISAKYRIFRIKKQNKEGD